MQRFRACFTPENRGKPEDQASLLPGEETDFHRNGSESGSEEKYALQQLRRNKQRRTYLIDSPIYFVLANHMDVQIMIGWIKRLLCTFIYSFYTASGFVELLGNK